MLFPNWKETVWALLPSPGTSAALALNEALQTHLFIHSALLALSPHIFAHVLPYFSLYFNPALDYRSKLAVKTASFIQNPWFMPFIIRISDKKTLNADPQMRSVENKVFFYPAVIITVLKKKKLVMCFLLIMSSSSITNKTYKIEKKTNLYIAYNTSFCAFRWWWGGWEGGGTHVPLDGGPFLYTLHTAAGNFPTNCPLSQAR